MGWGGGGGGVWRTEYRARNPCGTVANVGVRGEQGGSNRPHYRTVVERRSDTDNQWKARGFTRNTRQVKMKDWAELSCDWLVCWRQFFSH